MGQQKRKRDRLVPEDCIKVYEIRIVQMIDSTGEQWTTHEIIEPNGVDPALHEVMGSLELAKDEIKAEYNGE